MSEIKKLGKFEILAKVGQGAMGVVYKARDPLINRIVALKTLKAGMFEDSVLLKRFYSEARSAGSLRHPNIVTIYELGHEGDVPFIAMQFLDGESLDKVIDRLPNLPLSQRVGFIVHICRALEYAHTRNHPVVHRDVKPGNVVVGPDGSVVVVDFGIARLGETSVSLSSGLLIGTLGYMSPQLFRGGTADAQSDIWATGVMFYELLAYRRPFRGENAAALMSSVILEEPRPISEAAPGTPEEVEKILNRMLAKKVEERYQTMEEVLFDLEPVWKRLLKADISILLESSERLLNDGDLLAAKSEILQILNWDSTNTHAKLISELINSELRKQKFSPQVKVHLENAQRLLAEGHPEDARSEAQLALKLDSSCQPAGEIVRQVQVALERSREIHDALQSSEVLMAEGALTDAETQIEKALFLDPSNEEARNHLNQVRGERARREQRKQRDSLFQRARSLWTNLQYDDCVSLLVSMDKQFPNDPEIVKFLEAARLEQAEHQRQVLLVGIRNMLSAEQFDAALKSIEVFLVRFPDDATANSLRSHAFHGRDLQRREERVREGKFRLRELVSQKRYEEAIARGKEFQREFPWDSEFAGLLVSALTEQSQAEQRLRLEQVISQLQEMIKGGRFADAMEIAETALSEFPDNPQILGLAERARNEQAEKAKQQRVKERVRDIERMLKNQQLTDAVDLARQGISTLGADSRLLAVLHQGEKELEFRQQKKQRQAEAVQNAHLLIDDGKLTDAGLLLKDAIKSRLFSPEDLEVKALFEEIGARRNPTRLPNVPSVPKVPAASTISEITLVQPIADSARDYVLAGGPDQLEEPVHAEQLEEAGGVAAPGTGMKAGPLSSPPRVDSIATFCSELEAHGGESLDLRAIEKYLAVSLGPIASFIVEKATAIAKTQDELFAQLASTLSSQRDRETFLARKKQFVRSAPLEEQKVRAAAAAIDQPSSTPVLQSTSLNAADIRKASELAARYLGPVSLILAERAAQRSDSLHDLYLILADYLKENSERTQFLRDAGFPQS